MNMEKYDAVVVGGSCAGAAAGITLARAGRNTLIIDKAEFPRQKLCGGMITEKTIRLLQKIYTVSFDNLIDSRYNAFGVYHASLGRISSHRSEHILSMIHRDIFDDFFLKEAKKAGCTVYLGDKVIGIREGNINTAGRREIAADFIIGADGCHSVIRKELHRTIKDKNSPMGLEVNIALDNLKFYLPCEEVFPWIFFGYVQSGYGWVFPKKDFATVGIAGLAHYDDKNLLVALKFLLAAVCVDPDRVMGEIKGHPVPLNNCFEEPGFGNILLVGDAARLVEPLTGEGIYFAALSGRLAAHAILTHGDHAGIYNVSVKRYLSSLFRQARLARALYFNRWISSYAMHKMKGNAKWCRYFLALLSGEMDYVKYFKTVLRDRTVYPSL
jgi:geranylgeranyl reductase family protein